MIRRLSIGACLLGLAVPGCHRSDPLFIPLPSFDPDAKSLVIVVESASPLALEAVAIDEWSHHFDVPTAARVIHFMTYRESLAALGLSPGPLVVASPGACARRPLEPPLQRFVLTQVGEGSRFEPASGLPSVVLGLEIEIPCPCWSFEYELVDLGRLGHGRVLEAHQGGFRLLTTRGLFDLTSSLEIATSTIGFGPERFFIDESGVSWVVAQEGRLFRWRDDGALELVRQQVELGSLERVGPGPGPMELVIVARPGLYVWRGGAFELLSASTERLGSNQLSSLVSLPSGSVLAGIYRNHGLLRLRPGAQPVERLTWASDLDPPEVMGFVPEVGALLSTRTNRVFLSTDEGSSWRALDAPDPAHQLQSAAAFIPFEGGFIELGRGGLRQYAPGSGYCRAFMWPEATDLRAGVLRPDGSFLVVGEVPENDPGGSTPVFIVRPVERLRG